MRHPRFAAYGALVAGVLAFSTSGVLAKLCSAPPATAAFWVRFFSFACLIVAFVVRNGVRRALLADAASHGLAAGLVFGVHVLLYFWALKLTSVTVVFLLGALNPAVVGLFAWLFLDERPTRQQALWIAIAIAAAAAVVLGRDASGEIHVAGNVIAALAALGYCAYFLLSRHARRSVGTIEFLTVTTFVSMVVAGAVALVGGGPWRVSGRDLCLMALMGIVPGTLGHFTVSWALRDIEARIAATVLLAVPVFASLWAHVFAGEQVGVGQMLAGAVVLLAIPGAIRVQAATEAG